MKLLIWALHPIMYQTPIFRTLEKLSNDKIFVEVVFGSDLSLRTVFYDEISTNFKPDTPSLLDGFTYEILKNFTRKDRSGFWSRVNLSFPVKLIKSKPNYVLIHGYDTFSAWYICFWCLIFRVKILWRGEVTLKQNTVPKKIKMFALKHLFFKFMNKIFYSCSGNKAYLRAFGVPEDKLIFMPCCVDNEFFTNESLRLLPIKNDTKQKYGISQNSTVFMMSARMTKRKRVMDLLIAVSRSPYRDNCHVLVIGDGPELTKLQDFAISQEIKVVSVGHINQSEISELYSISDVSVILSEYDPSPKALNEAMNFGLPVIATSAVGTVPDLVINSVNGFVIEVGDIDALVKAISFFIENTEKRIKMGLHSSEIIKKWSLEASASAIISTLMLEDTL